MDGPGINFIGAMSQMGAMGILTYLAIYGLPRLLRAFQEEREKTLESFKSELKYERERCDSNLDCERETSERRHQEILSVLKGQT